MIHQLINEIYLNNSIHPVHIIIMIDEEMIGMIHGIGKRKKLTKICNLFFCNHLDQEITEILIVVHQVVVENRPIHHLPHLLGKSFPLVIINVIFFLLVHLDHFVHGLIQHHHQVDQGMFFYSLINLCYLIFILHFNFLFKLRFRSRSRSRPKRRSPSVTRATKPLPTTKSSEYIKFSFKKKPKLR